MPDTYNPDEIIKLKHLNEFAYQLACKIDGTIPGTQRNPTITVANVNCSSSTIRVPLNNVIHYSSSNRIVFTVDMQISALQSEVLPVITILDSPDNLMTFYAISFPANGDVVSISFLVDEYKAFYFDFNLSIAAGNSFAPFNQSFHVEVYND